jgi:hypothetical protein
MAMDIHANRRINMNNPMTDLWRAQQDAAARMTESWSTLLQPTADRTSADAEDTAREPADTDPVDLVDSDATNIDHSDEVAEPEPEPEHQFEPAALSAIQAIAVLGDGQRDFAQHMTRWAEHQRELADAMTAWASRQRDYADALDRVLASLPTGTVERPA